MLTVAMEVLHVRSQSRIHWKIECQLERGNCIRIPISPRRLEAWAHRERAMGLCWRQWACKLVVMMAGLWAERMG